jgi:predicted  nucleic acid-binding Zn-ribbon protein
MSTVETRITVLEDRSKSVEHQLVDVMMSNNRALEKSNEAYGKAIEANSIAKSSQDKITDTVANVKDEMKQLRKAMVNPLNN